MDRQVGKKGIWSKTNNKIMHPELREKLFKRVVEKWGIKEQLGMVTEEALELALAARKLQRVINEERFDHLMEEIADVEILIEQVKIIFPNGVPVIEEHKVNKLIRLEKRLDNNSFED